MPPETTDTSLPATPETPEPRTVMPVPTSTDVTTPSLSIPTTNAADTATVLPATDTPSAASSAPALIEPTPHAPAPAVAPETPVEHTLAPHSHFSGAPTSHHPSPRGGGRRGNRPISPETRARIDANIAQKEERLAVILAYVNEHGTITSRDIKQLFGVSLQTANTYTHDLIIRGNLKKNVVVTYTLATPLSSRG